MFNQQPDLSIIFEPSGQLLFVKLNGPFDESDFKLYRSSPDAKTFTLRVALSPTVIGEPKVTDSMLRDKPACTTPDQLTQQISNNALQNHFICEIALLINP